MNCQLGDEPVVRVSASDLGQVKAGDNATSVTVCHLSTGDWAIEAIEIELGERAADSASATLDARYRRLSDEPAAPRDVRSEHFLLHTDISDRQAQILLDKLEVMVDVEDRPEICCRSKFGQRHRPTQREISHYWK